MVFLALIGAAALGAVRMPAYFGDGMIMQTNGEYGARAFLNGMAAPGEQVTVKAGTVYHTQADASGAWDVQLRAPKGTITVSGESGPSIVAAGVQSGDVFFCSGQSNMVFPMSLTLNASAEMNTTVDYPFFKLFTVPQRTAATPQFDLDRTVPGQATWIDATPATVANFSAVCYMAVREIARLHTSKRPMGLIFSAWGGTRIEAWMSPKALSACAAKGFVAPASKAQNGASALFNAMVAPLTQYAVRAALWYQGEANADQGLRWNQSYSADYYACMMGGMAADWRERKRMGDFAFTTVQLPPSHAPSDDDAKPTGRQAVRDAASRFAPHSGGATDISGVAVTVDLGGSSAWGYDHPPNKNEIARRLALTTIHAAYAVQWDTLHFEGPQVGEIYSGSPAAAGAVVIVLKPVGNNKTAVATHLADVLDCTTCCKASNNTFEWSADGGRSWTGVAPGAVDASQPGKITLSDLGSAAATHVRYAWRDFVNCVVSNEDGLPMGPFSSKIGAYSTEEAASSARAASGATLNAPPMGFNSWNFYHCNIDENTLRALADAMVANGMKDAGYEYINIDDCWQVARGADGSITPDPVRFPSGMKAVADYIHARGLKFGVYTARGSRTCQGRPGSYQHELQDAATYCDWGLDYLKNDNCGGSNWPAENTSWINFQTGLDACYAKTGRYTVRSIEYCKDPAPSQCGGWIAGVANLWRTTGDVQATFDSCMGNLHAQDDMAPVARTGHYNDPDMLQVGNVGLSATEQRTHFAMWCVVGAPLLAGTDLVHASPETLAILTNKEVIAVNQDPGKGGDAPQGTKRGADANKNELWAKDLADGSSVAVALLNLGSANATIAADWDVLGLDTTATYAVRDLHAHKDLGSFSKATGLSQAVESHGVALLKFTAAAVP